MKENGPSCTWLARHPSKRWCEAFFLAYSVVWITSMAVVVIFQLYEVWHVLVIGLLSHGRRRH